MSFCRFSKDYEKSGFTYIDNLFITNYISKASNSVVRVYLYGLYLCQNAQEDVDLDTFCEKIDLPKDEVLDCFKYLDEEEIVDIVSTEPISIIFNSITSNTIKNRKYNPEKYSEFAKNIQYLITDRMITTTEFIEYFDLLENTPLNQEGLQAIIKFCVDFKGPNVSYKYIISVAKDWVKRGITTKSQIQKEVERLDKYVQILSSIQAKLHLSSYDIEDMKNYRVWTDKYGYSDDFIFDIAVLKKIDNFKKLNKLIDELYSNKCYSVEEADEYFKKKKSILNLTTNINLKLGIYIQNLENEINTYISDWLYKGYTEQTLLFLADYAFRTGRNSLENLNNIVIKLYNQGIVSFESIHEYIDSFTKDNNVIKEIFEICGVNRKPTKFDRESLHTWRNWNFTDEIILEAAKRSVGITNPIPYINGILSNWKSKEIFTIEGINERDQSSSIKTTAKKSKLINERNYSEEEYNSLIDSLEDIDL